MISDQGSQSPAVPPQKVYRMQELVWHTGLSRQTLHNYAVMGLIREAGWTVGGHRVFDESVFERLWQVGRLKKRYRLEEIRVMLGEALGAKGLRRSGSGAA
jgi:DNA-binding transcriptional MerR regulator